MLHSLPVSQFIEIQELHARNMDAEHVHHSDKVLSHE